MTKCLELFRMFTKVDFYRDVMTQADKKDVS